MYKDQGGRLERLPAFFVGGGYAVSFRLEVMGVDGGWFCWRGYAVSFRSGVLGMRGWFH